MNYTIPGAAVAIVEKFLDNVRRSRTSALTQSYGLASIALVVAGIMAMHGDGIFALTIVGVAVLIVLAGVFVQYLSSKSYDDRSVAFDIATGYESRLTALEQSRSKELGAIIGEPDRQQLVEAVGIRLREEAAAKLVSEIKVKVQQTMESGIIEARMSASIRRLEEEVDALSKRGNLNLAIGIVTTLGGLVVLGYTVFHPETVEELRVRLGIGGERLLEGRFDIIYLLYHYVPRASLVLFVELFALFFLRLYKASLDGIRYFQNEITNLESKFLAVTVGKLAGNQVLVGKLLTEIVLTERNRILSKNQTTVELELAKLSGQGLKEALTAVANEVRHRVNETRTQGRAAGKSQPSEHP